MKSYFGAKFSAPTAGMVLIVIFVGNYYVTVTLSWELNEIWPYTLKTGILAKGNSMS